MFVNLKYYLASFYANFSLKVVLGYMAGMLPIASDLLFGSAIPGLEAMLVIYFVDVILGLTIAFRDGTFKLARLRKGLYKFILFGIAIVIGNQIDIVLSNLATSFSFGDVNVTITKLWILGYIAIHEGISTLGKLHTLGVPIPEGLVKKLLGYKKFLNEEPTVTQETTITSTKKATEVSTTTTVTVPNPVIPPVEPEKTPV